MEQGAMKINIESIMDEIREKAKNLKYEEPVSFEDIITPVPSSNQTAGQPFDRLAFEDTLFKMNKLWTIPYGHEIMGNPVTKFIGRAARKMNKPTGGSMAEDITLFNAEVTRSLNSIRLFIIETEQKMEAQERKILELEEEIRKLKRKTVKKS